MTAAGGEIGIDTRCQTSVPGIFAAGDVTGPPWLSNRARAQGVIAATNALGGSARFRPERVPRSVNTHPELAAVGLTEAEAQARGLAVAVGYGELATSLRASRWMPTKAPSSWSWTPTSERSSEVTWWAWARRRSSPRWPSRW